MEQIDLNSKVEEYRLYIQHKYSEQEPQRSQKLQMLDEALQGDADAMVGVGISCCEGDGDFEFGFYWLNKSAYEKEYPDAFFWLGDTFFWGQGIQRDFNKVFECFDIAIQKGCKLWSPTICLYLETVDVKKVIPYYEYGYSAGYEDPTFKSKAAERLYVIYSGNVYPEFRCREKFDYWMTELRKYEPESPDIFDEHEFIDWVGEASRGLTKLMLENANSLRA